MADADDACDLIKVHAHPQTPARSFVYRANGFSAPLAEREALCAAIADDTDVLLSHAPPCGVLDDVGDTLEGCAALRRRVLQFNPALHVFGHCHNHGGVCVRAAGGTTFVNAAQAYAAPVVVRVRLVKK